MAQDIETNAPSIFLCRPSGAGGHAVVAGSHGSSPRATLSRPDGALSHNSAETNPTFAISHLFCAFCDCYSKIRPIFNEINSFQVTLGFARWVRLGSFLESSFVFNRVWVRSEKKSFVVREHSFARQRQTAP
jgi:hypothetical protein